MLTSMLKKRNIVFLLLLFSNQFWTLKLGPLSFAMLAFALTSMLVVRFRRTHLMGSIVLVSFLISILFVWPTQYESSLHYSRILPVISVVLQFLFLNLIIFFRKSILPNNTHIYVYVCLLFSTTAALLLTPENFLSPGDGFVGLFNEKGMYGYYLTLLALVLVVHRGTLSSYLLLAIILFYVLFVVEAARSLLLIIAFLFLVQQIEGRNKKLISILALSLTILLIAYSDFGDLLQIKLAILYSGDGQVGRYAAFSLLINSSPYELIFGHGYGTYLNYRALFIEMPDGAEYDYAGSLILQLLFEIGLLGTIAIFALLVKLIFGRVTLFFTGVLSCLTSIGGTHDIQMFVTIIIFMLIYRTMEIRRNEKFTNYPVTRAS